MQPSTSLPRPPGGSIGRSVSLGPRHLATPMDRYARFWSQESFLVVRGRLVRDEPNPANFDSALCQALHQKATLNQKSLGCKMPPRYRGGLSPLIAESVRPTIYGPGLEHTPGPRSRAAKRVGLNHNSSRIHRRLLGCTLGGSAAARFLTVPSDVPPPLPPLSWPVASGSSRIHRGALECLRAGHP
jgi:hypothetical protein